MLCVLSPSKTLAPLEPGSRKIAANSSQPVLFSDTLELIKHLKKLSPEAIKKLMDISDKLAELNFTRFQNFTAKMDKNNAQPAAFAFKGDVYDGLDIETLNTKQIGALNERVAIISGLYGLLRPLDLIQHYRLEMGTTLKNAAGRNLYDFWGDRITTEINKREKNLLVNLASEEYFKAVRKEKLKPELVNIVFKENKKGKTSVIGLFAKRARGMMTRFIVETDAQNKKDLLAFDAAGYKFSQKDSDSNNLIFIRKHA